MNRFNLAHKDEISIDVEINWSNPTTLDILNSGLEYSDDMAFFYAIIGKFGKEWWAYYIGMVFSQFVSERHKAKDHQNRLKQLKKIYPETVWHLTLGTPKLKTGRITKPLIEKVEGLLIYSHKHEEILNKKKIKGFSSFKSMRITNTGFTEPFFEEVVHGVFVADFYKEQKNR
jgi:hypothetical protein